MTVSRLGHGQFLFTRAAGTLLRAWAKVMLCLCWLASRVITFSTTATCLAVAVALAICQLIEDGTCPSEIAVLFR